MRDRLDEFGPSTEVVLVTFTDPDNIEWYQQHQNLPFPILIDEKRTAYHAYGMGRGSVRRIWGLRVLRRYIEIFRADGLLTGLSRMRGSEEDTLQLGGDMVVGPDGVLVFGFWGEGPDDRPDVDELIRAVKTSGQRPA